MISFVMISFVADKFCSLKSFVMISFVADKFCSLISFVMISFVTICFYGLLFIIGGCGDIDGTSRMVESQPRLQIQWETMWVHNELRTKLYCKYSANHQRYAWCVTIFKFHNNVFDSGHWYLLDFWIHSIQALTSM